MTASASSVLVIHCWVPDLNPLAAALGTGAGVFGCVFYALFTSLSWVAIIATVAGLTVLVLWLTYSRITVTTEAISLVGCGLLRRPHYTCPLAEVVLEHHRAIDGQWISDKDSPPLLEFYSDWDWDTPADYLTIKYQGERINNFFRLTQYATIRAAVATMVTQRLAATANQ